MKLVGIMILLPVLALLILTGTKFGQNTFGLSSDPDARSSAIEPVLPPDARTPDEVALLKIKREHSLGRYPFLVSSLCRDFIARYQHSPLRAEVEGILEQSQEVIRQSQAAPHEEPPAVPPAPPRDDDVTP
jgi:hypothetical protein